MALPLDTAPGPSPDEEAGRNMEISHNFLRQAREELAKEDLLQASNKAWGAAAYAIKAVAEKRRWFNDADWRLREAAWVISAEQADEDIMMGFLASREAHYSFYHHEEDSYTIGRILTATERLVGKLLVIVTTDEPPLHVGEEIEERIRRLQTPTSTMDRDRLANGRKHMDERPPALPPNEGEDSMGSEIGNP
ncbi:MAG: hypothetical protein OXR67_02550 [Chloroflexota bacterium]|nr:hypothetical protein [Chloroflexota bacterium]